MATSEAGAYNKKTPDQWINIIQNFLSFNNGDAKLVEKLMFDHYGLRFNIAEGGAVNVDIDDEEDEEYCPCPQCQAKDGLYMLHAAIGDVTTTFSEVLKDIDVYPKLVKQLKAAEKTLESILGELYDAGEDE